MWVSEHLFVCVCVSAYLYTLRKKRIHIQNWENFCCIHTDDDIKRQNRSCRFFYIVKRVYFFYGCVLPFGFAYIFYQLSFSRFLSHTLAKANTNIRTFVYTHRNSANVSTVIHLIFPFRVECCGTVSIYSYYATENNRKQQQQQSPKKKIINNKQNKARLLYVGNSCDDVVTRESVLRV